MNINYRTLFLVLSFIFVTAMSGEAAVSIGDQAPDFTAIDTNGNTQTLSGYKGKFVVLEWVNFDCPFVGKQYGSGNMQELQKTYTQKGVVWLTVSSSAPGKQGHYGPEETNRLVKEKGASPTAVILDSKGTIGRSYGAQTTPHMFIIDPQGRLIYQGAIDSVPGVDQSEIAEAENYVAAALDAALNGDPVKVSSTKSYGCSVKY